VLSAIILAGFVAVASAQKLPASKVPSAVKTAFAKQYPSTAVKWEKENGAYEAGFKQAGHEMSVNYSAKGEVLETETEIPISALPATAQEYLKKNYPGQKLKGAAKIVKSDGSATYEAEFKGTDVLFDEQGKFLKKEKD
jgi:hypothetical protein